MTVLVIAAIIHLSVTAGYALRLRLGAGNVPVAAVVWCAAAAALAGLLVSGPSGALIVTSLAGLVICGDLARRLLAVDRAMTGRTIRTRLRRTA